MDSLDSTILDEVGGFIVVLDRAGRIQRANRRARELLCQGAEPAGRTLLELATSGTPAGESLQRLAELAQHGRDGESRSMRLTSAAGDCLDATWRVLDLPRLPCRILLGEVLAAAPAAPDVEIARVEQERRRIARELHDETGQSLTSVLIGLRVLESANTVAQVQSHVEELRRIVRDALEGVRRMAAGLRPAAVEELGLLPALRQLAEDCSRSFGLAIEVNDAELTAVRLGPDAEAELYRIAQEALANVGRHARARRVELRLRREDNEVRMTIRDDGKGFDPGQRPGQGLRNIRERAQALHGSARIESWRGAGTVVTVTLPLAAGSVSASP